jgi:methionyl-tRNA formyltransferase
MKNIALLTTDTTHHTYFASELSKKYRSVHVLSESNLYHPHYDTSHKFEELREEHEKSKFFDGKNLSLKDVCEVQTINTISSPEGNAWFQKVKPSLTIVFGTGILKHFLIKEVGTPILNLHGGDPQEYRGLDSHLWTIFHRDFSNLVTCLHELTPKLDDGPIIEIMGLTIKPGMKLYELRESNTRVCVQLTNNAIEAFLNSGEIKGEPQKKVGRYYSAMPSCLKERCVAQFEKHTGAVNA